MIDPLQKPARGKYTNVLKEIDEYEVLQFQRSPKNPSLQAPGRARVPKAQLDAAVIPEGIGLAWDGRPKSPSLASLDSPSSRLCTPG